MAAPLPQACLSAASFSLLTTRRHSCLSVAAVRHQMLSGGAPGRCCAGLLAGAQALAARHFGGALGLGSVPLPFGHRSNMPSRTHAGGGFCSALPDIAIGGKSGSGYGSVCGVALFALRAFPHGCYALFFYPAAGCCLYAVLPSACWRQRLYVSCTALLYVPQRPALTFTFCLANSG